MAFFLSFVGLGLVFEDLGDVPTVGFGGDEDGGQLQWLRQLWLASYLLAFVFLNSPQLCSGRRGPWQLGWGSVSQWWLLSEFGGCGGNGFVLVMGVGMSIWLLLGHGGRGVWFT